MQPAVDLPQRDRLLARARPWVAVIVAAIIFALIPLIGLPLSFALPLIGIALAAGTPPDYVTAAKPVARKPRNLILGVLVLILLAIMILQPRLNLLLVDLFGLEYAGLAVTLIAVLGSACHWRWPTRQRRSETCLRAGWC